MTLYKKMKKYGLLKNPQKRETKKASGFWKPDAGWNQLNGLVAFAAAAAVTASSAAAAATATAAAAATIFSWPSFVDGERSSVRFLAVQGVDGRVASLPLPISTKPKPFERPVSRSMMT